MLEVSYLSMYLSICNQKEDYLAKGGSPAREVLFLHGREPDGFETTSVPKQSLTRACRMGLLIV